MVRIGLKFMEEMQKILEEISFILMMLVSSALLKLINTYMRIYISEKIET